MAAETIVSGFRLRNVLDWISARTWLVLIPVLFTAFLLTKAFQENDFKFIYDEDGRQYYQTALEMKEYGRFLSPLEGDTAPYGFRLPFYQTFLSFFAKPESVPGTFQPQHAALELSFCSLIFLGFMIAGNVMTGITALCCVFAFSYYNLKYGVDVEVEGFYAMMVALFMLCGVNYFNSKTRFSALLWGLSAGLSLEVRSSLLVFVPLCAAILALKQKYRAHALIFLSAALLILLPLTIRNYRLLHKFIPFENNAATVNIYIASLGPAGLGDLDISESMAEPLKKEFTNGDNTVKFRILHAEIRRNLVSYPLRYVKGCIKRLREGYRIFPLLLPVLLFALYKKEPIHLFIGGLCLYYVLIHSLMYILPRYFFPIQLPIYILSFCMIDAVLFHKGTVRSAQALKRAEWTAISFVCLALLVYARQTLILLRESPQPVSLSSAGEALSRHPHDVWLLREYGRLQLLHGDYAAAYANLGKAAILFPEDRLIRIDLATAALLKNHKYGRPSAGADLMKRMFLRENEPADTFDCKGYALKALYELGTGREQEAAKSIRMAELSSSAVMPVKLKSGDTDEEKLRSAGAAVRERTLPELLRYFPAGIKQKLCTGFISLSEKKMSKSARSLWCANMLFTGRTSWQELPFTPEDMTRAQIRPGRQDTPLNYRDRIERALFLARNENKRVILEVGGDWCSWCKKLDIFYEYDPDAAAFRKRNFITVKIYAVQNGPPPLDTSVYPLFDSCPHLYVLGSDGSLLRSQPTESFEAGEGYDRNKILSFLRTWAPAHGR